MIKKRVSIKDIARLAGVSSPTVSRALHGRGRISDTTRERIVKLADEVGYTPSLVARGLVTQRSYCVGLIVPQFADPFQSEIAQGVEDEARQHHYSLFMASAGVDPARELEIARTFHGRQVDGIVVSASRAGNRYAKIERETGTPIVLLNTHVEDHLFHSIRHDDYMGICHLVRHLLDCGYRRIAFVGNERGFRATADRQQAWVDTLRAAGLVPELAVNGPSGRIYGGTVAAGRLLERAHALWRQPPEAICCYNDTMAIGVLSVLRQHGLRAPDDVAITGFDDVDVAAFLEPPLTTWRQPRYKMGVEAMKVLLSLINQEESPAQPKMSKMSGEFVLRNSTRLGRTVQTATRSDDAKTNAIYE